MRNIIDWIGTHTACFSTGALSVYFGIKWAEGSWTAFFLALCELNAFILLAIIVYKDITGKLEREYNEKEAKITAKVAKMFKEEYPYNEIEQESERRDYDIKEAGWKNEAEDNDDTEKND